MLTTTTTSRRTYCYTTRRIVMYCGNKSSVVKWLGFFFFFTVYSLSSVQKFVVYGIDSEEMKNHTRIRVTGNGCCFIRDFEAAWVSSEP